MKKAAALLILIFLLYSWVRVIINRRYYNLIELNIWLVIIGLGGAWCIVTLFSK